MAFMQPQYIRATAHDYVCTACNDDLTLPADTEHCPACGSALDDWGRSDSTGDVWYRLSAPGYMDCTEWCGPFPNVFRAARDLCRTFDVHPRTGDEFDY